MAYSASGTNPQRLWPGKCYGITAVTWSSGAVWVPVVDPAKDPRDWALWGVW